MHWGGWILADFRTSKKRTFDDWVEELESWDQHHFALFSRGLVLFSLNSLCATCSLPVFCFCHLSYLFILLIGDELLGMDGARYLKLDDFKDQDDDFLSPKKTLRDFEGGMGTT